MDPAAVHRPSEPASDAQATGRWLFLLAGLFAARVVAQPLALVVETRLLPRFEAWHSGALPYPILLATQGVILWWLLRTAQRVSSGNCAPHPGTGRRIMAAGGVYATVMAARLVLGATLLADIRWFASPIPTVFHLGLAAYLLVYGSFLIRQRASAAGPGDTDRGGTGLTQDWMPSYHYPTVIVAAFGLFAALGTAGFPLVVQTYVPVVLTALAVAAMERHAPNRREWEPDLGEVTTDLTFLAVVQLAVPPLVGFLFTFLLLGPARSLHLPTTALWPHHWPYGLQALAMVLTVDFLRYWLHRAAHETDLLWRLHAVHHSVDRLYWLNTSRFHPIEKALQMCLDSLPFLLLGVHETVLALYYVAYATNGFFQHCNIRLRYGILNYIVGSAETHRWHHSREPREANANYGNTVIVWDLLFGTWFLPPDREVTDLGLHDRGFPRTFAAMMRAPFRR